MFWCGVTVICLFNFICITLNDCEIVFCGVSSNGVRIIIIVTYSSEPGVLKCCVIFVYFSTFKTRF